MASRKAYWWVDVGMAMFVAAFIAIVLFVDGSAFNVVMGIFIAALFLWTLVAEVVARDTDTGGGEEATPAVNGARGMTPLHN